MNNTRCSVVGLGKLGSPLLSVLASKRFPVIGVDLNAKIVHSLNTGIAPYFEPDLQEYINKGKSFLRATTSIEEAILESELTFVIVPTPSNSSGFFSNEHILSALENIGKALRKKSSYHVVNITSTVMPGSCEGEIRQCLEQASGRRVGSNLGLCYNPEFIAIGSVIKDMLNPDLVLIGESDKKAGDLLEKIYRNSCNNNPSIQRMNLVNAEITKLSINTFVTTKISYTNMLADMCDNIHGADVDVITKALGKDRRIGNLYLKCGVGYGGPCFPRDNIAFAALARSVGASAEFAETTDKINNYQAERLIKIIEKHVPQKRKIAILGLTYKPNTNIIEASQSLALINNLLQLNYTLYAYDPSGMENAKAVFHEQVTYLDSAEACANNVDLMIITTPWPEFSQISISALQRSGKRLAIIDCWRLLDPAKYSEVVDLIYPGKSPARVIPTTENSSVEMCVA